jgi:FAD/FMN-containing dehydrogenase
MAHEWVNWSGSLRFTPERVVHPAGEEEVCELVRDAAMRGRPLRPVGSGHTASGIIATDGTIMSLTRMRGVVCASRRGREAVILPGTTLQEAGAVLLGYGLAMHNLGDIANQTVAGAICTGTHGTGNRLCNLSWMLVGGRLVKGDGEVFEFSADDGDFLRAARVSLGTLGVFTQCRVRLMMTYMLRREEMCVPFDEAFDHIERYIEDNRHFDFYWYLF